MNALKAPQTSLAAFSLDLPLAGDRFPVPFNFPRPYKPSGSVEGKPLKATRKPGFIIIFSVVRGIDYKTEISSHGTQLSLVSLQGTQWTGRAGSGFAFTL